MFLVSLKISFFFGSNSSSDFEISFKEFGGINFNCLKNNVLSSFDLSLSNEHQPLGQKINYSHLNFFATFFIVNSRSSCNSLRYIIKEQVVHLF